MSFIIFLTEIFFAIWAIRSILFWISLWQVKEYRLDRMVVHITDTEQGKKLFFSPFLFVKIFAILIYIYVVLHPSFLPLYQIGVSCIFFALGVVVVQEIRNRVVKRPRTTVKALAIFLLSFFVVMLLFWIPLLEQVVWLLLLERLIPLIVVVFVYFFSFPTEMQRDFKIARAVEKIRENKKLLVIGVTGSYGKSTTKEFASQILRKKFRVAKTKGTNNTPIGVANAILSSLQESTEIFVVEMGAYKKGEIADLCRIVHPKIGILTAVNQQHASLFGGLENTMEAKYELIESLPKNGLALFNGNNDNARRLYEKTEKKKLLYVCADIKEKNAITAINIVVQKTFVTFEVLINRKKLVLSAPILGKHNIENMLPGIYLASYLGMTDTEIADAVSMLSLPGQTMTRHEIGGVNLIDDSFNANPDSVRAALDYMCLYSGKKLLVLQPMIELGKLAKEEHRNIGKAIGNVCDFLLLTNTNYLASLQEGLKKGNKKCTIFVGNPVVLEQYLTKHTKKGDVVVFEGKEAGLSLEKIL